MKHRANSSGFCAGANGLPQKLGDNVVKGRYRTTGKIKLAIYDLCLTSGFICLYTQEVGIFTCLFQNYSCDFRSLRCHFLQKLARLWPGGEDLKRFKCRVQLTSWERKGNRRFGFGRVSYDSFRGHSHPVWDEIIRICWCFHWTSRSLLLSKWNSSWGNICPGVHLHVEKLSCFTVHIFMLFFLLSLPSGIL
jgi:hypothetical protein